MTARDEHFAESIQALTPLHQEYPSRLRDISEPPRTLYIKGTLPPEDRPSVAIIGARDGTDLGKDIARSLGSVLARHGITVISGMAYGIDTAGHWGALEGGGKTYAVLGSGLDVCYPPSNFHLYEEILRTGGGLLSELPLHSPPLRGHFASRNRIISGLSDAIIVVEAKARSGTFITVGDALEQGKQIFAVPGRVNDRLSEGCNQLIKEGASILTSSQDILEYFHLKMQKEQQVIPPDVRRFPPDVRAVWRSLSAEAIHIDTLAKTLRLPISRLTEILLELELQGLIESPNVGYYRQKLSGRDFL